MESAHEAGRLLIDTWQLVQKLVRLARYTSEMESLTDQRGSCAGKRV